MTAISQQPRSTIPANPQNSALSRLKARRKRWLGVHLWLGLTLGFLLSIYGITGSILVFHAEIDEWLNSELLTVAPPSQTADYEPLAEIFAAARTVMPPPAKPTFATYPRNQQAAFQCSYALLISQNVVQNWQVYVDPYTARVTGKRLIRNSDDWLPNTFIDLMFELHYALLIPSEDISTVIVGVSAALLIISALSGLIVWWPLTGKWRQALTIKAKPGKVRFNYDLHKTSGFYTALVMVPVLFSGIYMVLPHNVVPVLELFSPVTYRYGFQSKPPYPNAPAIGMDEAVAIAFKQYPQGRPHWIYGAAEPTKTYTVCQDGVDAPGSILQRRCTVIDRYSGKILDLDDPSLPTATACEIFTHWQWPLHSGQAFGMTGRILVFITGLACPVLFVTGVIRWRQKRRAGQNNRKNFAV
ncbi:PepSY-associated TM helix domain-containing protein [Methylomonas sp. OY6]|uniref:PepSY-associated TM helix domain-containing protein n=1 Tax=Methylomonas defluvii TaxID=3045149 RepID=A0ABU4UDP0_9GAMM|nr:PepSY-associated TM helix domain-containing protein [Methylomonas sp. OY6]MDX8127062.1 PepSY-associated TM helix domain-containing protein [Methylomonas sp. OY6]